MRLVVIAPFTKYRAGIPRVAEEWVVRLLRHKRLEQLTIFQVSAHARYPLELLQNNKVRIVRLRVLRKPWHILKFFAIARRSTAVLIFTVTYDYVAKLIYQFSKTGLLRVPIIQFIYDFAVYHYPKTLPDDILDHYEMIRNDFKNIPAGYVVISKSTKEDMKKYWGILSEKIHIIYLGSFVKPREPRTEFGSKFVLSIGTIEPRKNLDCLLDAFLIAKKEVPEAELLIIGREGWKVKKFMRRLRELVTKRGSGVKYLGSVPDVELEKYYRQVDVLVYPSLWEGFGLPPLEAMAAGCPVITSNNSSFPEVVGEAGIMVDPINTKALAREIIRVLNDDMLKKRLSRKGVEQAQRFSWEQSAGELYELLSLLSK